MLLAASLFCFQALYKILQIYFNMLLWTPVPTNIFATFAMDLVTNGSQKLETMQRLSISLILLVTNVICVQNSSNPKNLLKIIDHIITKDPNKVEASHLSLYCFQILFKTLQTCCNLFQRIQNPRSISAPSVMGLVTKADSMFGTTSSPNIFQKHLHTLVMFVTQH